MILYIHFGIYKAGSSYLQYVCANKREELIENGIWFPKASDDHKLKAGGISAGNGFELSEYLKTGASKDVINYLKARLAETKYRHCHATLLSAEALIHCFQNENKLKLLKKLASEVGFTEIRALAFIREIVDHSLSLYKHRSKSGKNADFENWLENSYETPKVLNNFFDNYQKVPIQWSLKLFKKDANYMLNSFFNQWLNINIKEYPIKPQVNESITLSEVRAIQIFNSHYKKSLSNILLKRFEKLSKIEKGIDKEFETLFKSRSFKILSEKYSHHILKWSQKVAIDYNLLLAYPTRMDSFEEYEKIVLTGSQINAIIEVSQYLSSINSFYFRLKRNLIEFIPSSKLKKFIKYLRH